MGDNSLEHLEDFLLHIQTNNYSSETLYNYERDLKVFEIFLNTEVATPFNAISKKTVEQFKAFLISRDRVTASGHSGQNLLSSGSINRCLSSLRRYLKYLIKMDYHSPLAPEAIELVRMEKKHPRVGEFAEIVKLIESPSRLERNRIIAARNRAMMEVLFSTGLRISELITLRGEQIDRQGRIFVRGKGKKERFVYLTDRARRYLNKYLRVRGSAKTPYLFIPYRGKNFGQREKRISPNYLQDKIKRYREQLGINVPLSAHSLRHAFATYLAESGANPAAIQILLGHESLDTTTRYVHASDRYAERTHRKFHPLQR